MQILELENHRRRKEEELNRIYKREKEAEAQRGKTSLENNALASTQLWLNSGYPSEQSEKHPDLHCPQEDQSMQSTIHQRTATPAQ